LLDHDFVIMDTLVMLVAIDTPDGQNRVLANVFTEPGKAQLLWKHRDRANLSNAVYVLGKCVEAQVPAYFPWYSFNV